MWEKSPWSIIVCMRLMNASRGILGRVKAGMSDSFVPAQLVQRLLQGVQTLVWWIGLGLCWQ